MDKKELQKLIKESLKGMNFKEDVSAQDQMMDTDEFENSLGSGEEDYGDEDMNLGLEPMPMSAVDMPIQDKGVVNMGGNQSYDDEFSDVSGYVDTPTGDSYEDYQDDVSVSPGYFNEDEEVPMSAVDMPIQDKAVFSAMDDEEVQDDMSDLARYRKAKGGDYEGGFQDDVSVSPGYFNEEEEIDPIALAKTNAMSSYDPTQDAMDYAGEHWNTLTPREKSEIFADLENEKRRAMGESIEFTSKQLQETIKEGVEKLHRKTLIENRLEQINNELNMINNPEAWESARTEAKTQLAKKTVAWNNISTREGFLSEISFRDVASIIPVETPKDKATKEADSKWNNMQKESVSEIMGRAADLMAEAKKKYNDISK
jgi:hypothetical protein